MVIKLREGRDKMTTGYEALFKEYSTTKAELSALQDNYRVVCKSDRDSKSMIKEYKRDKDDLAAMVAQMQLKLDMAVEDHTAKTSLITDLRNEIEDLKNKMSKWSKASIINSVIVEEVEIDKNRKLKGIGYAPPLCNNFNAIPDSEARLNKLSEPVWIDLKSKDEIKTATGQPFMSGGFMNDTPKEGSVNGSATLNPNVAEYVPVTPTPGPQTVVQPQPAPSTPIKQATSVEIEISKPETVVPPIVIGQVKSTPIRITSPVTSDSSKGGSNSPVSPKLILCTNCHRKDHVYKDCPNKRKAQSKAGLNVNKAFDKLETPKFYQNKPKREKPAGAYYYNKRRTTPPKQKIPVSQHKQNSNGIFKKLKQQVANLLSQFPKIVKNKNVKTSVSSDAVTEASKLSKGQRYRRNRQLRKAAESKRKSTEIPPKQISSKIPMVNLSEIPVITAGGPGCILKEVTYIAMDGKSKTTLVWISPN